MNFQPEEKSKKEQPALGYLDFVLCSNAPITELSGWPKDIEVDIQDSSFTLTSHPNYKLTITNFDTSAGFLEAFKNYFNENPNYSVGIAYNITCQGSKEYLLAITNLATDKVEVALIPKLLSEYLLESKVIEPIPCSLGDITEWKDRYAAYSKLRRNSPIHWDKEMNAWLVTRHHDITMLARSPNLVMGRILQDKLKNTPIENREKIEPVIEFLSKWMIYNDGNTHLEIKRAISQGFTSNVADAMRTSVKIKSQIAMQKLANNFPGQQFDLMEGFGHPFPATVLGSLFGIPDNKADIFLNWSESIGAFMQDLVVNPTPNTHLSEHAYETIQEMTEFFISASKNDISELGEGFSRMIPNWRGDPSSLAAQCAHLVFGGHKVPSFAYGSTMQFLLRKPDLSSAILQDRTLIPALIDEAIRLESPVQYITRVASSDIKIDDLTIKEGDNVYLFIGSANRDESYFDNPTEFQINRFNSRSLSFGFGAHTCIAIPFVKMELEEMINATLDYLPKMQLAYPEQDFWSDNATFHGPTRLPVKIYE